FQPCDIPRMLESNGCRAGDRLQEASVAAGEPLETVGGHGGIKQSDSRAGRHERETNHLVAVDGAAVAKSFFRDGVVDGKWLVTWTPDTTVGCRQNTVAITIRQQNRNTFNRHQPENQFEYARLDFTPIAQRIDPAVELQDSIKHDTHFRFVVCLALAGFQLAVPFLFGRSSCQCRGIHFPIAAVEIHKNRAAHANAVAVQKNLSGKTESVHECARRALHIPQHRTITLAGNAAVLCRYEWILELDAALPALANNYVERAEGKRQSLQGTRNPNDSWIHIARD